MGGEFFQGFCSLAPGVRKASPLATISRPSRAQFRSRGAALDSSQGWGFANPWLASETPGTRAQPLDEISLQMRKLPPRHPFQILRNMPSMAFAHFLFRAH